MPFSGVGEHLGSLAGIGLGPGVARRQPCLDLPSLPSPAGIGLSPGVASRQPCLAYLA